jgi:hypothetical protein
LPKKLTSFDALCAYDMATVFSHVNSVPRPSLGGASAMQLAQAIFPKSFFDELGLSCVLTKDICLKPTLINNSKKGGLA